MSLTPVSREAMRSLKSLKDEEARLKRIDSLVHHIYRSSVNLAETTTTTSFNYSVPQENITRQVVEPICMYGTTPTRYVSTREIIPEIISGLQSLFPNCSVKYTTLTRGQDGKMYDISLMDPQILPFIDKKHAQEYIVVDWS